MNNCGGIGASLSKVHPPIYAIVLEVMLRSTEEPSLQEEGLTSEGIHIFA